ncbi:hypothetical protein KFL_002860030 [Klebsormidium nitens]|uniref:Cardiolipin synthase N-terminal domain-containing protein n=1 Tax=Klebsormidium nitens TaxID=105231 RepID=A0A1Y1IAB9_KLENI|nr:hypothetical protein KFL_002860030 [Klebsormidium nitens]|eukprot:GAQ86379.1 hypothetical protein KFL_002860030 [Klebsormidium nitens]
MLALWFFWAGLAYYAFAIAPNQTPTRDEYFLGKLTLLIQDDYPINQVLLSEFNIMGIWPFIYTALLIPSGRSKNLRPPVWPFASLSMGIGIGGLLPYFALWQQPTPPPPSQEERQKLPLKVLESKIFAGALLAGALGLIGTAVASGPDSWVGFSQYFNESKLIHVMTLDFFCLQLFCPFWLYNDMEFRKWSGRNMWIVPLSLLPVLGPALYLLIRPPLPEPTSNGPKVAEAPKPIG